MGNCARPPATWYQWQHKSKRILLFLKDSTLLSISGRAEGACASCSAYLQAGGEVSPALHACCDNSYQIIKVSTGISGSWQKAHHSEGCRILILERGREKGMRGPLWSPMISSQDGIRSSGGNRSRSDYMYNDDKSLFPGPACSLVFLPFCESITQTMPRERRILVTALPPWATSKRAPYLLTSAQSLSVWHFI